MVCASVIPLSSLTLQLRSGWHMPATWATPRVLHGVFALEHISSLVTRIATSWWFGWESSAGFNFCCHLQKLYSVLSAFTVMSSPCCKQTFVPPPRVIDIYIYILCVYRYIRALVQRFVHYATSVRDVPPDLDARHNGFALFSCQAIRISFETEFIENRKINFPFEQLKRIVKVKDIIGLKERRIFFLIEYFYLWYIYS